MFDLLQSLIHTYGFLKFIYMGLVWTVIVVASVGTAAFVYWLWDYFQDCFEVKPLFKSLKRKMIKR